MYCRPYNPNKVGSQWLSDNVGTLHEIPTRLGRPLHSLKCPFIHKVCHECKYKVRERLTEGERKKTRREDHFLFVLKNMKPELWDHDMYLLITSHNKSPSFLWACPLHPNNFVQSANFQKPRPRHFDVFWTQERGWGRRLVLQQQALLQNRNVCWD